MKPGPGGAGAPRGGSPLWAVIAVGGILLVAWLHYSASHEHAATPHQIYRRLYYLPILAASWAFGLRGGLIIAAAAVVSYVPHAFGLGMHIDPSSTVDKVAELCFYPSVGGLVGGFVDRERGISRRLLQVVSELESTLTQREALLLERDETIEQRDEALAKLGTARDQLVTAEHRAAMGHLTAGLAHEIRNPLGSIRGSAEILESALPEGDKHRRIAALLIRETERLDDVLTRFLRFASQEAPRRAPTHLGELVDEVMELVAAEGRQRGVETTHVRCTAIPTIELDAGQLRQLLLNLVVNALQMQPDGGMIRVSSGLDAKGSALPLFLRVEDSGPGLPEGGGAEIFHPYYSARPGGTGLGLAIARRVATDHGGTLESSASSLGGACFELRLPLPAGHSDRGENA